MLQHGAGNAGLFHARYAPPGHVAPTIGPFTGWARFCIVSGPDRAAVAQWIEYWPPKPRVVGSIPASRAIPHTVLASKPFTKRQPTGLAFLFLVLCWSRPLQSRSSSVRPPDWIYRKRPIAVYHLVSLTVRSAARAVGYFVCVLFLSGHCLP